MCEAYRHFSAQLRGRVTFNDTLQLDQWAFVYNGQSMTFVSADGSKGDLGTAILERIPYGDRLLSMPEIVRACEVQDIGRRSSFLPRELTHPRAPFVIDYELPAVRQLPTDYIRRHLSAVKRSC